MCSGTDNTPETLTRREIIRETGGINLFYFILGKTQQIHTFYGPCRLETILNNAQDADGLGMMIINSITKGKAVEKIEGDRVVFRSAAYKNLQIWHLEYHFSHSPTPGFNYKPRYWNPEKKFEERIKQSRKRWLPKTERRQALYSRRVHQGIVPASPRGRAPLSRPSKRSFVPLLLFHWLWS